MNASNTNSTTNAKREAISYGRFSSSKQEEGDSTNRQSNAYDSVLNRYGEKVSAFGAVRIQKTCSTRARAVFTANT